MMENREVMMRIAPEVFYDHAVEPVDNYGDELLQALQSVAPRNANKEPTCALLTPGPFNSAYYEHSFLADKLGIELVEGATSSCATLCSTCAQRLGRSELMSFTDASMMISSTRWSSIPIPCSASQA